ncbi:kinase-like protein [Colletotrichum falcatum]|nr:kinase-like protein [Colletotrichum falcatum]
MAQQREEDFSPHHHSRTLSDDLGPPPPPSIVIEPNPSLDAIRGNPVVETISRQHQSAASEQTSVGRRNRANDDAPGPFCPGPGSSYAGLTLDRLLMRHFQKHPQPEVTEGYLPDGYLESIVCFETVKQELEKEFVDEDLDLDRLAHDICNEDRGKPSYRQVFALLCLIDKVGTVRRFLDPATGVCDKDLPLQRVDSDGNGNIDLRKRTALDDPLQCFLKWKHNALKSFDDWQWTLNVPILSRVSGTEAQYRKFDDRVILPLVSESSPHENGGVGGYSEVFKIQIHPRHHDFDQTNSSGFFALKKLKSADIAAFQRELQNLRKFESDNSHPHLISLLTTWSQKGFFHFLFPWADCDLLRYWEDNPRPTMSRDLVQWVARQSTGMADGLARIHDYPGRVEGSAENAARYGRHGDIKPENILWFRSRAGDMGKLVISDFGLGAFHTRASRSGIPNTSGIGRTPSYRPPECDIEGAHISRSWDIWTLGCVFVEFATWMLGGWDLVEQFTTWRLNRTSIWGQDYISDLFFDIVDLRQQESGGSGGMGAQIKPSVTRWFQGLHNHGRCTQYIHDLLEFVEDKMLIVESATRKRAPCNAVFSQLQKLEERCASNAGYCIDAVPWALPESWQESAAVRITLTSDALDIIQQSHPNLRTHFGRTEEPPRPRTGHGNHLLPDTGNRPHRS